MLGIGKNVQIQRTEKQTLFIGTKLILGAERGEYKKINQRPERLYQVIGKVKCVHRAFMVYSEDRQQTMHCQRAGDAAPDDGIAVIERGIVYTVVPPREAFPECSCTVEKHKTWIASPATIPKSGERNRKIHSCMLYLISI